MMKQVGKHVCDSMGQTSCLRKWSDVKLLNAKISCRILKSPPQDSVLNHMNPLHSLTVMQILLILYLHFANMRYGLFPPTPLTFPSIALTMIIVEQFKLWNSFLCSIPIFLVFSSIRFTFYSQHFNLKYQPNWSRALGAPLCWIYE